MRWSLRKKRLMLYKEGKNLLSQEIWVCTRDSCVKTQGTVFQRGQ